MRWLFAIGVVLHLLPGRASAAEFFVDPVHGDADNDGSSASPWKSLQDVIDRGLIETRTWDDFPYREGRVLVPKNTGAPVRGGDTIVLRAGYHGDLVIVGHYNARNIQVVAQKGHDPRFRSILVRAGSHWVFRGLHVGLDYAPDREPTVMIKVESHNHHGPVRDVTIEECRLQSIGDSSGWSAEDWNRFAGDGIEAHGERMTIRGNVLRNVDFGISVDASDSLVERNLIENFSGDGMRGFGTRTVFQYNTIKNCYDVNDNHDDGFQSWSSGPGGVGTGEVVGIVLRGNTIINNEDPNQPHRGTLQGIGCFDGNYVDWVIENNVVIVDHWHGISFLGLHGSRIVNNTVIDARAGGPGPAAILVAPHKNGSPSRGNLVRNNLTTALNIEGRGAKADHNRIARNPAKLFVDVKRHDLRLRKGTPAIDAGAADGAPTIDRDEVPRPWGARHDLGAYEYHEGEVGPAPSGDPGASPIGARSSDPEARVPEPRPGAGRQVIPEPEAAPAAGEPPSAARTEPLLGEPRARETRAWIGWAAAVVALSVVLLAWRLRTARR